MTNSKIQFIKNYKDLKSGLTALGISGQQVKKHLNSTQRKLAVTAFRAVEVKFDLLNSGRINPAYSGPEARIIAENDEFLALEKPHKLHCYPQSYQEQDNLLSFLRTSSQGKMLQEFSEFVDRNLIFRLDYETAGVVLFLKNSERKMDLKNLRGSGEVEKHYFTLVAGRSKVIGEQHNYFTSKGQKGEQVICHKESMPNSREGSLEVLGSEYDPETDSSLVLVKLKTGVRHQIRSFFVMQGTPIIGDHFYGGREANQLCLHACSYQLEGFKAFSKPLFLRDFLNLNSGFKMLCDQFGIGEVV